MKLKTFILLLISLCLLTACADVTNIDACRTVEPYGFWGGLWHGMTCSISFIGSLFSDDIAIYAVNNNGGWYDFGFLLGSGIFLKGVFELTYLGLKAFLKIFKPKRKTRRPPWMKQ